MDDNFTKALEKGAGGERLSREDAFALVDAINRSQDHGGTYLGQAVRDVTGMPTSMAEQRRYPSYHPLYRTGGRPSQLAIGFKPERLIVITDEQSHDAVPNPPDGINGYMINVASYKNGVGYGPWHHIDGWSESIVKYIIAYEKGE